MTSNIGADLIQNQTSIGFELAQNEEEAREREYEEMRSKLLKELKKAFRPEFINRVDSVIVFHSLTRENIRDIVSLEMDKVRDRLKEKNLELKVTEEGVDLLAELGYNPEMGARPLRRVIQHKIENQLSDALLEGRFKAGDLVIVDASYPDDEEEEGEIVLEKGDPSEVENGVKPEDTEEPVPVG